MKKSWTILIILACVAGFAALVTPRLWRVHELKERSQRLSEEIRRVRWENQRLETELQLLREDPVYIERVAREKFHKAKEGEIVYRIVKEGELPAR